MKKLLLFLLVTSVFLSCQKHDGYLTTEIKNGAGVIKELKFEIDETTIKEIEELNFISNKDVNQVVRNSLAFAGGYIGVQLNNPNSYDFIDNSIGNIKVVSDTIKISYNFTAQNGFGNNIISKAYVYVYDENGTEGTDVNIEQ